MATQYTIGLDYGTNSVRALIVNVANGAEVAAAVWIYEHGTQGVILARDPNLARQHPADYLKGAEVTIKQALATAKKSVKGFNASQVIGIGGRKSPSGSCCKPSCAPVTPMNRSTCVYHGAMSRYRIGQSFPWPSFALASKSRSLQR